MTELKAIMKQQNSRRWLGVGAAILAGSLALAAQTPPAAIYDVTPAAPTAPTAPTAPAAPQAPAPAPTPMPTPSPAPAPRAMAPAMAQVYAFGSGSYLGVDVADLTSERAKELKLNEERGAEITAVDSDAPAGKAGLKEHDVVLSLNGARVESAEQLRRMIKELPAGRTVTLGISREGRAQSITATLGDRRALSARTMPRAARAGHDESFYVPSMPPMAAIDFPQIQVFTRSTTSVRGLMMESLSTQLGEYFGAPNGRGLLVTSVEKGTAAETAGLKAGDVIVKVNGERVSDVSDWRSAVRGKTGQSITLGIIREKREQSVTLKVPERGENDNSRMHIEMPDVEPMLAGIQPLIEGIELKALETSSRAVEQAMREMERKMRDSERQFERERATKEREIKQKIKRVEKEKLRTVSELE